MHLLVRRRGRRWLSVLISSLDIVPMVDEHLDSFGRGSLKR